MDDETKIGANVINLPEKTHKMLNGIDADFHCPSCKKGTLASIGYTQHTIETLVEDELMTYYLVCDNCQIMWELELKMKEETDNG